MKQYRRIPGIFSILLCLVTLFASIPARADTAAHSPVFVTLSDAVKLPAAPEIHSDYAILVEAKSGTILYEKNAYAKAYPASITKIMTALLVMENCDMSETVEYSYRACHELASGSSSIARTEGEKMSVLDSLYGMMVASANEVAQALAEHVAGSFEAFAAKMTLRAYELGAVNSNFANPHGTPDPDHYTCAHDMAVITREAVKNDLLREIMGTAKYQIAPTNKHSEITYLRMKHPLLTDNINMRYEGAVAGKTGYTSEALNTLVTYAVRGNMELICVVMHADGTAATAEDSTALFNYGFQNFNCYDLSARSEVSAAAGSAYLGADILSFTAAEDYYITLPAGTSPDELTEAVSYGGENVQDTVATKKYSLNGVTLASIPLTVNPVKPSLPSTVTVTTALTSRDILREVHFGLPLIYWILIGGGLVLLLILAIIILIALRIRKVRKRRKLRKQRALNRMSQQSEHKEIL